MSWTTEDLREVMTERSAGMPAAPERASRAVALGVRRQRLAAGAGALVALMVLGLGVGVVSWANTPGAAESGVAGQGTDETPSRLIHTGEVAGLVITTDGPARITTTAMHDGLAELAVVEVTIRNDTASAWSGHVGVGVLGTEQDSASSFTLLPVSYDWGEPIGFDGRVEGRYLAGGMWGRALTVPAGGTLRRTLRIDVNSQGTTLPVQAWLPVLDPGSDRQQTPDVAGYPLARWS